ncbi:MAG: Gfo/Idh/MocA family oxidoreductase, partial [Armatimonadetes bacterium]|nr:Gfo/Idh/MocA family oxidoreductase [Armatimonadota bacterium]
MSLRVMVVGLGFGYVFAQILRDHPDCDLVGVADLNEETAARIAREFGLSRAACSLDDVLAMPDVDAVALFTHAPRHAEHSIAALRAGKHVLCAVPAAISLDQCEELIRTVEETGLVYANAETSYWRPQTAQCRRWHNEGAFGRIVYM